MLSSDIKTIKTICGRIIHLMNLIAVNGRFPSLSYLIINNTGNEHLSRIIYIIHLNLLIFFKWRLVRIIIIIHKNDD